MNKPLQANKSSLITMVVSTRFYTLLKVTKTLSLCYFRSKMHQLPSICMQICQKSVDVVSPAEVLNECYTVQPFWFNKLRYLRLTENVHHARNSLIAQSKSNHDSLKYWASFISIHWDLHSDAQIRVADTFSARSILIIRSVVSQSFGHRHQGFLTICLNL